MTEKVEETVEVKPTSLPKRLSITFDGTRAGIMLYGAELPNALTKDGKIDRDSVFRIGRLPEDFSRYTLIADDKPVAYLTRGEKNWVAHYLNDDGSEKSKKNFDRTETKKARRKGSKLPALIDAGPDLLMVVTKVAKEIWPEMAVTARTGGSRTSSYKKKASEQETKIVDLLEKLAAATGKTIEEVAKDAGVDIPEGYKKAIAEDEQASAEEMQTITSAPANKPKSK